MTLPTLRILLLIQILSLAIVAAIHAGVIGGGPFERAAMYEAGVAVILAIGLALTWAGPTLARWGAFGAQLLALFGVGTGVYMGLNGMAPNTPADFAYHTIAMGLLLTGMVVALRLPSGETADDSPEVVRSYRRGT